jgi:hypothetical protein
MKRYRLICRGIRDAYFCFDTHTKKRESLGSCHDYSPVTAHTSKKRLRKISSQTAGILTGVPPTFTGNLNCPSRAGGAVHPIAILQILIQIETIQVLQCDEVVSVGGKAKAKFSSSYHYSFLAALISA